MLGTGDAWLMETDSKLMFQHRSEYHEDKQTGDVAWGMCNIIQGLWETVMQVFEAHGVICARFEKS